LCTRNHLHSIPKGINKVSRIAEVFAHTLKVVSAYPRLAAVAAIESFSPIFFRRSSSSWISFIVFLAGAVLVDVHTGALAAGVAAASPPLGVTATRAPV
jgi:hypothetical protein